MSDDEKLNEETTMARRLHAEFFIQTSKFNLSSAKRARLRRHPCSNRRLLVNRAA
jgi:hypothetical protein